MKKVNNVCVICGKDLGSGESISKINLTYDENMKEYKKQVIENYCLDCFDGELISLNVIEER